MFQALFEEMLISLPDRGGAGVVLVEGVHAAGRPDVPQPHLRCTPRCHSRTDSGAPGQHPHPCLDGHREQGLRSQPRGTTGVGGILFISLFWPIRLLTAG